LPRASPGRLDKALLCLDTDFVDEDVAGIAEELIVIHGGARECVAQGTQTGSLRRALSLWLF
jgi:hypothetical protein